MTRTTVLGVVLFSLGLVACRNETPAANGDGGGGGGGGPSVTITSPTDGADATSPVHLVIQASGVQIGPTDTGNDHFHVYLGADYTVVTSTETDLDVPDGKQTIRVVLAEPNHNELDVSDSVTVNVTGGGGTAAGGNDTGGYSR